MRASTHARVTPATALATTTAFSARYVVNHPACRSRLASSRQNRFNNQPKALSFTVTESSECVDDVRAAAACRALAFADKVPSDRSEFAKRAQIEMKIEGETKSLRNKLRLEGAPREPGYEGVPVRLIIAQTELTDGNMPTGFDLRDGMHPCSLVFGSNGTQSLVLGSLDINVGDRLPAEESIGERSPGKRAYLSNVSVVPPARRLGIAVAMIERALEIARDDIGIEMMYVHVETRNSAALALYRHCGFEIESEETEGAASTLGRPPRILLRRECV